MIHLTSITNTADPDGSFFNGLEGAFPAQSGQSSASVDVLVRSGPVILALYAGNGSTLIADAFSSTRGQWETLSATATAGTNPNLLILCSYSTTCTGEFFADQADVRAVPEPSYFVLCGLGIAGLGGYARHRRGPSKAAI